MSVELVQLFDDSLDVLDESTREDSLIGDVSYQVLLQLLTVRFSLSFKLGSPFFHSIEQLLHLFSLCSDAFIKLRLGIIVTRGHRTLGDRRPASR